MTAVKDGLRLIAVVMKEPDKASRTKDAAALLDYGFANYHKDILIQANELSEIMSVEKGIPETIQITNASELGLVCRSDEKMIEVNRQLVFYHTEAPILQNEIVGHMTIELQNGKTISSDLIALQSSHRLTFWPIFKRCITEMLA